MPYSPRIYGLSPRTGRSRAGRVRHDHLSFLLAPGLMVFDHQPIVVPLAHPDPRLNALRNRGVIARRVGAVGPHIEVEVGIEAPRGPRPPAPMEVMLVFLPMPAAVCPTVPRGRVGMGRTPDDEDQDHEESHNALTHTRAPFRGIPVPHPPHHADRGLDHVLPWSVPMGHRQAPGRVVERGPTVLQLLEPLRSSLSLVRTTISRHHAPSPLSKAPPMPN